MKSILALSFIGILAAQSASAVVVTLTASGTMFGDSYDYTQIFGGGASLVGTRATVSFAYDTESLPNRTSWTDAIYSFDSAAGTVEATLFTSASVSVNGISYAIVGNVSTEASILRSDTRPWQEELALAARDYFDLDDPGNNRLINRGVYFDLYSLPDGLVSLSDLSALEGASVPARSYASFYVADYDQDAYSYRANASGQFRPDTLSVTITESPTPVPLPAGAPLVLTGLAALYGLRRAKARVA